MKTKRFEAAMVNRNPFQSHCRAPLTARFSSRKRSPFAVTLQIFLVFAFSIFVFFLYTRNVLEHESTRPLVSEESQSQQVIMFFLFPLLRLEYSVFAFFGVSVGG